MNKHPIQLSQEHRVALQQLVSSGGAPARKVQHAYILLKSDSSNEGPNWSDQRIGKLTERVSRFSVEE